METRLLFATTLALVLAQVHGQTTTATFADQTVTVGDSAQVTCGYMLATGTTLKTIQLQKEGPAGSNTYADVAIFNDTDATISGDTAKYSDHTLTSTELTVTITPLVVADEGNYKCIVTDSADATAENIGVLTVTDVDQCLSNPCQNGGTCVDGRGLYTCTCPACYTGINCESQKQNECTSNPCQNGGTCNDLCDRYTCTCPDNFNGTNCEAGCDNIKSTSPSSKVYFLDDQVTLTCTPNNAIQTGDQVYWSMKADGSDKYATTATTTFKMHTNKAGSHYCFVEQGGCTARSNATVLTYNYTISVTAADTAYENLTITMGETRTLQCSAYGTPNPIVQWFFLRKMEDDAKDDENADANSTTTTTTMGTTTMPTAIAITNATANSSTLVISAASSGDAGTYTCVASVPSSAIKINVHVVDVRVEPPMVQPSTGLAAWEIALIVIGCVVFVILIVVIVIIVLWKTGKAGAICPSDKAGIVERGSNKENNAPYEKRSSYSPKKLRTDDASEENEEQTVLPPIVSKTGKKKKNKYEADSAPRPLPAPPAGKRGGTLPPLDMEAEKEEKPKKKKKKPKKKVEEEEEERDSGNDEDRD